MTDKKTKRAPATFLTAEIVGIGPAVTVKVEPKGDKVTVGEDTWIVDPREDIFNTKKGPKVILVKGRGRALPVWKEPPGNVTSQQMDTTANNNLLEQFNALAKGNKAGKSNAGIYIALGILALVLIGGAIHNDGTVKDLGKSIQDRETAAQQRATDSSAATPGHDTSACTPGTTGCPRSR